MRSPRLFALPPPRPRLPLGDSDGCIARHPDISMVVLGEITSVPLSVPTLMIMQMLAERVSSGLA